MVEKYLFRFDQTFLMYIEEFVEKKIILIDLGFGHDA